MATTITYSYSLDGTDISRNDPPYDELSRQRARFLHTGPGSLLIPAFDASIDQRQLPELGWLVIATASAMADYGNLLMALSCYCLRYRIPLHIEPLVLLHNRHFFTGRHRATAKYLKFYRNLIVTDADTLVADSSIDVRKWLDDEVDVVLNDR